MGRVAGVSPLGRARVGGPQERGGRPSIVSLSAVIAKGAGVTARVPATYVNV